MPEAKDNEASVAISEFVEAQSQAFKSLFGQLSASSDAGDGEPQAHWTGIARQIQNMRLDYQASQVSQQRPMPHYSDPVKWIATAEEVLRALPMSDPARQKRLWSDGLDLFQTVLGQYGIGPKAEKAAAAGDQGPAMPRQDRRFSDPRWRSNPFFAMLHQSYLMLSDELISMADSAEGLEPVRKGQLRFATRALLDALSPANFALTNPVALERARETGGQSMVDGMDHMLKDLARRLQVSLDKVPFVGDNQGDVQAARAAGALPVLVLTGKGERVRHLTEMEGVPV